MDPLRSSAIPALLAACTLAGAGATPRTAAALTPSTAGEPARHCRLDVDLDPAGHRIAGTATFSLTAVEETLDDGHLRLALHPDLTLDSVRAYGQELAWDEPERSPTDGGERHYRLRIDEPSGVVALQLAWSGELHQDVAAGERPGEIHNREMSAHIGEDGIYLAPEASWHPRLDRTSCIWTLTLRSPFPVVASGNLTAESEGTSTWRVPFPIPGMTVAGGDHEVHTQTRGTKTLRVHASRESAAFVAGILDAVGGYLDLYEPLLGDYPFDQFTVVENFFSSGFAYPGFTLLSAQVVRMGDRSLRPGYLDHELLHNWWGNGVLPEPGGGHWSEALASYCANYMRPILEGDAERGRSYRRGVVETLSRDADLAAQAVGSFGVEAGTSGFIGYQKGALVFDQLAGVIGQDAVWAGLRRVVEQRFGRPTGWHDLRRAFEAESGVDLERFFEYWVYRPSLPGLEARRASWGDGTLSVATRSDAPFSIALPIRARMPGGERRDLIVHVEPGEGAMQLRLPERPATVEVDPDFSVLRRFPTALLMPSLGAIGPSSPLTVVLDGDDLAGYDVVRDAFSERFGDVEGLTVRKRFKARWLDDGSVLLLGRAALGEAAARLFSDRLEIWETGFEVSPVRYVADGDAVLACVRNPRHAGAVVCLYHGNADAALEQARLLTFYGGNSLLIFDHGSPVQRRDFAATETLDVGSS